MANEIGNRKSVRANDKTKRGSHDRPGTCLGAGGARGRAVPAYQISWHLGASRHPRAVRGGGQLPWRAALQAEA
eukprot:6195919-Pleurochrysis_carterae.AAC.3